MDFRVWAPDAKEMELDIVDRARHEQRVAMKKDEFGWWSLQMTDAGHGTEYGYRIDSGDLLPDPRSNFQPHGVNGRSTVVDHCQFKWTDQHWRAPLLSAAIIYELHVGTFTPEGTFQSAIERLDHLVDLGITHIELMPVGEFLGDRGWGYDSVDLFAPHHAYGGPDGLKQLVNACHEKNLAVILDVVYNHLGPAGNVLSKYAPYFTDRHNTTWGWALNFDGPHSDEVRRFFCDNALMWFDDYHFDGLRLDAVHAIIDTSAVHILEQLSTEVSELQSHLGRPLILIAESDLNDPRVIRQWQLGGLGIDAQWSDDIHHALHSVLTGERAGYYQDFGTLKELAIAMRRPYVYDGRHSSHRMRSHGRPATGLSGHNFVAYMQNHDQLGNRAQGDRMSHLVSTDRSKIGAALMLMSPFVPMLFQGEEWAASTPFCYFVDFHEDQALADAVTEGRPKEFAGFGWEPKDIPNPQDIKTFNDSKLRWEERSSGEHKEMLDWYRELIKIRRETQALTDGRLELVSTHYDEQRRWLQVRRGSLVVLCNFGIDETELDTGTAGGEILLASKPCEMINETRLILPPDAVAIYGPNMREYSNKRMASRESLASLVDRQRMVSNADRAK